MCYAGVLENTELGRAHDYILVVTELGRSFRPVVLIRGWLCDPRGRAGDGDHQHLVWRGHGCCEPSFNAQTAAAQQESSSPKYQNMPLLRCSGFCL